MPLGPKACLLPCMHRGGMPPQVPSDAHAASKVEEPVAAAALDSASQDSRHVQTDSEVPELCALIVRCCALRVYHRVLCGLLQVPTAVGSTENLPPPTMSSQHHLPLNAFLDTTRDPPVESASTVEPTVPAGREQARSRAGTGLIISVAPPSAAPISDGRCHPTRVDALGHNHACWVRKAGMRLSRVSPTARHARFARLA